jgi:signal transduction histidine kinase
VLPASAAPAGPAAPPAPAAPAPPAPAPAASADPDAVAETKAWAAPPSWDLLNAVVYLAGLVIVSSEAQDTAERLIALAAVIALGPWYVLLGRPQIGTGRPSRRTVVYLTGMVALFGVAVLLVPNAWFLAIAVFPQCYQLLDTRLALIPAIAMTAIGGFSVAYWAPGRSGIETAIALSVAVLAFTVALGSYLTRIITQSEERAGLIGELEASRAEVARLSREAGALAERQRLAGDIHDTLAQGFSSILMLLQAAQAQLGLAPPAARRQLALAEQTARENLAEARTLVAGLATAQLQAGTLEEALRRITERAGAELGIRAGFEVAGQDCPLLAATEVVLLRAGQEALANVRKHAAASGVTVRLRYGCGQVSLEVADDGVGFDPAAAADGYGLPGMRARAGQVGGTVTVRSQRQAGTTVLVEVPA